MLCFDQSSRKHSASYVFFSLIHGEVVDSQVRLWCKAVYFQKYICPVPLNTVGKQHLLSALCCFFVACAEGHPSRFLSGSCYKCLHFPAHSPSAILALSAFSIIHSTQMSSSSSPKMMNSPIPGFASGPQWKSFLCAAQLLSGLALT